MTARDRLIREIAQAPDELIEEVLDFLHFVKTRRFPDSSVADASPKREQVYEKISRVKGLLRDRKESFLSYANQVRQEWE